MGQLNAGQLFSMFIAKGIVPANGALVGESGGCVAGLGLTGAVMAGLFFVGKSLFKKRH